VQAYSLTTTKNVNMLARFCTCARPISSDRFSQSMQRYHYFNHSKMRARDAHP
jgi:hypothetical protein